MPIVREQSTGIPLQHAGSVEWLPGSIHVAAGAAVQPTSSTIHNTAHCLKRLKLLLPCPLL